MSTFGASSLIKRIGELPKSPCEKACGYLRACSDGLLSCNAFRAYQEFGISHPRQADDKPTHDKYLIQKEDRDHLPDGGHENLVAFRKEMKRQVFA